MADLESTNWLARTKLHPPSLRQDAIPRPRLLDLLLQALLNSRLTLISAPAGYGKTTLLAALSEAAPDLPLAWISLDEEDNDPARFLAALVLAMRRVFPGFGNVTLSLLGELPKPGVEPRHAIAALVNDLLDASTPRFALVLDDLHLVSRPQVHTALDYFLERMPPSTHVAIATRHDPPLSLARLRARGSMSELRGTDIRFTEEETAELLNDRLRLGLGPREMDRLHARLEGWPAGLRLLANSLQRMGSPTERAAFIGNLSQSGRHLFDYLAAEVLDRQEPPLRRFLLETSILPELTPELCRAVTDREDAEATLEELERRGLFVVVPRGTETPRYHALFAEFLQNRLKRELPGRLPELHRRAAEATPMPSRAISHYLAAERWDDAAGLMERFGSAMLRDGLGGSVEAWLRGLPPGMLSDRPGLALLSGVCSYQSRDLAGARAQLERAASALAAASDEASAGEALSYLALCLFLQTEFADAEAAIDRGLALSAVPHQRVRLLMTRSWLDICNRSWTRAVADLDAALAEVEAAPSLETVAALGLHLRMDLAALPGGLERIERFLRVAVPLAGEGITPLGVALQEVVAFSHLRRGRLEEGLQICERTVAQVQRLGGHPYLGLEAAGFGALAYLARGNCEAADRLLEPIFSQLMAIPIGRLYLAAPLYARGKMRLHQGDLEGARLVCGEIWAAAREPESTEAPVLRWKLRGHLAMAERRYTAAERDLHEAAALEEQLPPSTLFGTSHTLLARLAHERGRSEAAQAELEPVLARCERDDTPGLILVDGREAAPVLELAARRRLHGAYAGKLLRLLGPSAQPGVSAVPATSELLSERERQILLLVAAGASNRAVGERLVIEETTVKSHVSSLLRKLGASSRTHAVARARELGLLDPPTP